MNAELVQVDIAADYSRLVDAIGGTPVNLNTRQGKELLPGHASQIDPLPIVDDRRN